MSNELTTENAITGTVSKMPVPIGERGLILNDLDGLWRFSQYVARSGLAPKGIQTNEAIFVAVQMGLEVGLTPMAALQNIAVINGRPSIWGDAQLAVVRGTGQLEGFEEWYEQDGKRLPRNPATYPDSTTAVCRIKRRGYPAAEVGFSVADAKLGKLWGKDGPWTQYPFRMLKSRARAFALRDMFGDALKGILTAEEAGDLKDERIPEPSFMKADPMTQIPPLTRVNQTPPLAQVPMVVDIFPPTEPATRAKTRAPKPAAVAEAPEGGMNICKAIRSLLATAAPAISEDFFMGWWRTSGGPDSTAEAKTLEEVAHLARPSLEAVINDWENAVQAMRGGV